MCIRDSIYGIGTEQPGGPTVSNADYITRDVESLLQRGNYTGAVNYLDNLTANGKIDAGTASAILNSYPILKQIMMGG